MRNVFKLSIVALIFLALLTPVFAVCSVTFDGENYAAGDTITADMVCDSGTESNKAYTLTWYNRSNMSRWDLILETDVGTTPSGSSTHFYETYVTNLTYSGNITANLTGTNLEGSDTANIGTAGANELLISNIAFGGGWLGLSSSVRADVTDENSKKLSGATCSFELMSNDRTIVVQDVVRISNDGSVFSSFLLDPSAFKEDTDYLVEIHCYCGQNNTDRVCIDEDGNEVTNSLKSTVAPFRTNKWLNFHNDPIPITFQNGSVFSNPAVFAGYEEKVYYLLFNVTNNYPGKLQIVNTPYLVNNLTGEIFLEPIQMPRDYGVEEGNTSSITPFVIDEDAISGVYYIRNFMEVTYNGIPVAIYMINTETFTVTGTDETLTIGNIATDKNWYFTGEYMHVCANITNTYDERIEFNLDYAVHCSVSGLDFSTDRSIIARKNEIRAVNTGVSQYQCAYFDVPFIEHLLFQDSSCYASVTIESPYITTYDNKVAATSPYFNLTDFGLYTNMDINPEYPIIRVFPSWRFMDEIVDSIPRNYFKTGINISILDESKLDPDNIVPNGDWDLYAMFSENMPCTHNIYNYTVLHADGSTTTHGTEAKELTWFDADREYHTGCGIGIENIDLNLAADGYFDVYVWYEDFEERSTEATELIRDYELLEVVALNNITNYEMWQFYSMENTSNFTLRMASALEAAVGRKSSSYSKAVYIGAEGVDSPAITESHLMKFHLNTLNVPANGDSFKVTYFFYPRSGAGELVEEIETYVEGSPFNHSIYLRSANLNPIYETETYNIYSIISMRNTEGIWEDFQASFVGSIVVTSFSGVSDGGSAPAGPYDVIVDTIGDTFSHSSKITARITLKNTGDAPDEDTILYYYLIDPDGNKFDESKEQFLEVPIGTTVLRRSLYVPENATYGEWRFVAEYHTVVQPMITVYDTFRVTDSVWKIFAGLGIILVVFWFIFAKKRRDKGKRSQRSVLHG